jgi:hypothetical protein
MKKDRKEQENSFEQRERVINVPESVMESHIKDVNRLAREVRSMALQKIAPSIYESEQKGFICTTEYDEFVRKHFVLGEIDQVRFWLGLLRGVPFEEYRKKYATHCLLTDEDMLKYSR